MPVIPLRDSAVTTPDDPETRELDDAASQFRKIRARLAHVCSGYVRSGSSEPSKFPLVTLDGHHLMTYWFGPSAILLSCRTVSELPYHGELVVVEAVLTMPGHDGQGFAKRAMRALLHACSGVSAPVVCRPDDQMHERLNVEVDGTDIDQRRLIRTVKDFGFSEIDDFKTHWLALTQTG